MKETEEHFYLEISEPYRPHIAPRYAFLRPVTMFDRKIGLEPLLGPNILYAEAFPLSLAEELRQVLRRHFGPGFQILPVSCNAPRLTLPDDLRKVIGV